MNIHPMFVHFPIALLTLYALMRLLPRRASAKFSWWDGATALLVFVGWPMTLISAMTGGIAEGIVKDKVPMELIEKHEMFAGLTILLFFVFFSSELVKVFQRSGRGERIASKNALFGSMWNMKIKAAGLFLDTPLTKVLALVGLVLLTFTGALGGSIVYGSEADPIVSWVYHLFF